MKARDIFGMILRTIAAVILLFGVWYLVFAIAEASGLPERRPGEMTAFVVAGIPAVLLGVTLLRFARSVVRFTYRGNRDDSDINA